MNSLPVSIGCVKLGGGKHVVIQSMTDTDTADRDATVEQILELANAGSEMVRITVDRNESAKAVPFIIEKVREFSSVPIIGDFHYCGHILLARYPEMAQALDKWRINPGNVGMGETRDIHFEQIISLAIQYNKPVRIGVNGGSLDSELLKKEMDAAEGKSSDQVFVETMVKSALLSAQKALDMGMKKNKIVLSVKHSDVSLMVEAYRKLAQQCDYALHLGLTEAGGGMDGLISSSAALGILLHEKIGDTIRISITPQKGEKRTKEVRACKSLLQALGLRQFSPRIISCPGCGRTSGNMFAEFAQSLSDQIEKKSVKWSQYRYFPQMKIAVMGCIVNGEGEAAHADIGIFFPGTGEGKLAIIQVGNERQTVEGEREEIENTFLHEVELFLKNKNKQTIC